jgi:hypothetical protein
MAEPQLSVRSAKARDLAHRLAKQENRSVAQVVERALVMYQRQAAPAEDAAAFYARMSRDFGVDIDLEEIIKAGRKERKDRDPL